MEDENIGGIIYQSTTISENEFNNILDRIINLFSNEKISEEEIQAAGNYEINTLIYRSNLHGLKCYKTKLRFITFNFYKCIYTYLN